MTEISSGKVVRWLLIASLAVNLAVAGLALGVWLHGGPGRHAMVRDLGFGPFDAALRPQDREALKALVRQRAGDLTATRRDMAGDLTAVVAALRTDPLDAAALEAAFARQEDHLGARMKLGNDAVRAFLTGLSAADRAGFANRLEKGLMHGPAGDPPK
jgi:uncharacterized membrane protein